jgi:hypothetical protein
MLSFLFFPQKVERDGKIKDYLATVRLSIGSLPSKTYNSNDFIHNSGFGGRIYHTKDY